MAKFCIIAIDYENHVPRDGMKNGLDSLSNQTFKDFDLVICHDGPKAMPYEKEYDFKSAGFNPIYLNTPERINDWGHSSRDYALAYAYNNLDCDYYLVFNIDNTLFPEALEKINNKIDDEDSKIVIYGIYHVKEGREISGNPPVLNNVDCMQFIAHKDIWKENNFWYNKEMASDGYMIQDMCSKNQWSIINEVLGINR